MQARLNRREVLLFPFSMAVLVTVALLSDAALTRAAAVAVVLPRILRQRKLRLGGQFDAVQHRAVEKVFGAVA